MFTFGAGSCGQLGHDSMNDEVNPRRVLELMGSEVSQIACGRGVLCAVKRIPPVEVNADAESCK